MTVELLPDVSDTVEGHEAERPVGDAAERDMVPANPERLAKDTLSMPDEPELNEIDPGAVMLKSVTFTPSVTAWLSEPLVPVMVSV